MRASIRSPKDFWAGLIYMGFGLTAIFLARDYGMGTAMRMGAGYFPTVLGLFLTLIGVIAVLRSWRLEGAAVEHINLRGIFLIVGPILLFALLVRQLGLLFAIPVLVCCSAYASSKFRPLPTLGVALGLTVLCSLVFIKGLGIPLPLLGSWFGN